jgi:hypothetical protein
MHAAMNDDDHDPIEPPNFGVARARVLRVQDDELADLRQAYESFTPLEQATIRAALERAEGVSCELAELGIRLKIEVEHDERDEAGNTTRWANCEFSLPATLMAIRAWDAGDVFAPNEPLP